MELNEYWTAARSTAIYPDLGSNYIYPTLGLCGEASEICEKVVDFPDEIISNQETLKEGADAVKDLKKEFGDILWYVANLKTELDLEVEPCDDLIEDTFLETYALNISAQAGHVAEKVKKAIRDKDGKLDDGDKFVIEGSLCRIVTWVAAASSKLGSSLEEVCQINIDKLMSRKKRNVLQGEGDNR